MVDGISWNPFTQKALTPEEIAQLDANKNGKVEQNEFNQGITWLSGGQDQEGEVNIGNNTLVEAAKNAGMKEKAQNADELKQNITILKDEYIEQYFTQNPSLTQDQRASALTFINNATNEFVNAYLRDNASGPYDMSTVAQLYTLSIEDKIKDNETAIKNVNAAKNGYVNNLDTNYDSMVNIANTSLGRDKDVADNYITGNEWNQVKNKAIQYLMGSLISGNIDTDLLNNISSKYAQNSYYQNALKTINELKNCNDPVKMQELMTVAQNELNKFLTYFGGDKVVNAIVDTEKAKQEEAIEAELNKIVDSWTETQITSEMTDEEKAKVSAFATSVVGRFLALLEDNNELDSSKLTTIKEQFNTYISEEYTKFTTTQAELETKAGSIETSHDALIKTSNAAKENGNISAEEKTNIVDAGATFVYQQLLADLDNIPLLANLNTNYKNTADFKGIETTISKIKSCSDPSEIQKLEAEVMKQIKEFLNKFTTTQLTTAVDKTKAVEISPETKDKALYYSAIGNDYAADVCRSSNKGKQNEDRLEDIQRIAKEDIAKFAEGLKAQLKAELGAAYDEAAIDAIIKSATNDTIALFSQNADRRRDKDDYIPKDEYNFVFDRSFCSKRGRYRYNLQALINKFTEFFNAAAKVYKNEQNDPNAITYDKQDVIEETMSYDYNRETKIKGKENEIRNQTKAKLMTLATAIQQQLEAKGCKIPSGEITQMLNESMQEVLENLKINEIKLFNKTISRNINIKVVVDDFMARFDAKLQEAQGKVDDKKEKEKEPENK